MENKLFLTLAFAGLLCIVSVQSQTSTSTTSRMAPTPNLNSVWAKVQQFNTDIQEMKDSGNVN